MRQIIRNAQKQSAKHAHEMVAEVARKMAEESYDIWMSKNGKKQSECPDRNWWVKRNTQVYLSEARKILASMLNRNDVSEADKERIHQALVLDNTLKLGRIAGDPQIMR